MNKIIVSGHTTKQIEMSTSQNGNHFAFFTIAVNEGKDSQGNEQTTFIDCKAFGKTAESLSGIETDKVLGIVGRLHQNNFTTQNGEKRSKLELVVETYEILYWGEKETKETKSSYKPDEIDIPSQDLPF